MIGRVLGSYRVMREIGRGGMGAVYLAEHPIIGRRAALKVLLPEYSKNAELVNRFFNEARAAGRLNHPAFVDVFDCGVSDESAFIAMEYVPGESLGKRLERMQRLPVLEALELTRQIAEAIGVAHRHGIVHRDLKPDNVIVVTADGGGGTPIRVKILDFGIAKLTTEEREGPRTRTGIIMGTPLYMSPEQCRGSGAVDRRADVYALGCILYALVCGHPPFPLQGDGEILVAHLHEPVPPLRSLMPELPVSLDAVVLRALAKAPEDRFQDMDAFAHELVRLKTAAAAGAEFAPERPIAGRTVALGAPGAVPVPVSGPSPRAGRTSVLPGGAARSAPSPTTFSRTASELVPTSPGRAPARRRGLVWLGGGTVTLTAIAIVAIVAAGGGGTEPVAPPRPAPAAIVPAGLSSVAPRAPAAPAPVAPRPAPRPTVVVRIESTPAGARVTDDLDGSLVGVTPLEKVLPRAGRPWVLMIEKRGHRGRKLIVPLDADGEHRVELGRKPVEAEVDPDAHRKL